MLRALAVALPSDDRDVVKLVTTALHPHDVLALRNGVAQARREGSCHSAILVCSSLVECHCAGWLGTDAVIALCMGPPGVLSRILCDHLSPVTHPLLPTPAAPGQLTIHALRTLQQQLGVVTAR